MLMSVRFHNPSFGCSKCELGKEAVVTLVDKGLSREAAENLLDYYAPTNGKNHVPLDFPIPHDVLIKNVSRKILANPDIVIKQLNEKGIY
ncbi:MAG: hypothetical protein WCG23_03180 [bacterium]